jgi:hypothetical protein
MALQSLTTSYPIRCLSCITCVVGLAACPAVAGEMAGKSRTTGMDHQARQEVRINVSVRPIMRVSQFPADSSARNGAMSTLFCVWSNTATGLYDVRLEFGGNAGIGAARGRPTPFRLEGDGTLVAPTDRQFWVRNRVAEADGQNCFAKQSILTSMITTDRIRHDLPASGVLTLLIAPQ